MAGGVPGPVSGFFVAGFERRFEQFAKDVFRRFRASVWHHRRGWTLAVRAMSVAIMTLAC